MPTVYFAKFNINEKIYSVYKEKENLTELLNSIYLGINTEVELQEDVKKKVINYKFITLDKKEGVINGRLVAYAPGTHVSYDDESDDVIETKDNKKATYITFCFDIHKEIIGFVPKNDFGRNQFLDRFKNLVEKMVPEVGEVEIYLESDKQALEEKLKAFKLVQEITIELIPPNNDKELFEVLFNTKPEELSETGGNKFTFQIKGSAKKGINLAANYLKRLAQGVAIGYGKLVANGKNTSDEKITVKSDRDALYTKGIAEHNKDSIPQIEEKTRAGVIQLQALKIQAYDENKSLIERMKLKDKLMKEMIQNEQGTREE
ncbi:hypothetical protein LC728_16190 [Bacillus amyloliquefaciens]|uniref:hypothetical protein n=1 Tax=Bacillus amyloliquefaciens TaxID=1390 RepID=UPI001CD562E7|nr:hypothetical protein [Bacillus amyloliquefaciens]MCA1215906.1 hypothetical protein [Bacillus amyloliquefaciens]